MMNSLRLTSNFSSTIKSKSILSDYNKSHRSMFANSDFIKGNFTNLTNLMKSVLIPMGTSIKFSRMDNRIFFIPDNRSIIGNNNTLSKINNLDNFKPLSELSCHCNGGIKNALYARSIKF